MLLKQEKIPDVEQFETLRQLLQKAISEINGLSQNAETAASKMDKTEELCGGRFLIKLEELKALLESDMGAAEICMNNLFENVARTEEAQAVLEIATKMETFEIDDAIFLIHKLRAKLIEKWS